MVDYIEIELLLNGQGFMADNLKFYSKTAWNTLNYRLNAGHKELDVSYNIECDILKIRGSLPYFLNGHNIHFSQDEFTQSIDLISSLLGVNIWEGVVTTFEYGLVVETEHHYKSVLEAHAKLKGCKLAIYDHGRQFTSRRGKFRLKLYNPWKNTPNKMTKAVREQLKQDGFTPSDRAIKVEVHVKDARIVSGRDYPLIKNLVLPGFQKVCKDFLKRRYDDIEKMKPLVIPGDKKVADSLGIALCAYSDGENQWAEKVLSRINSFPDRVLSPSDKQQRRRIIRKKIDQLTNERSDFDLGKLIK